MPWVETRRDLLIDMDSNQIIDKELIESYLAAVKEKYNILTSTDIKEYA